MDEEYLKIVSDYFTSAELVSLLDIPAEDLVYLILDYIVDNKEELDEFMRYGS